MKRPIAAQGFTIIEAMIVLSVTSAMFIVAVLAFSGQQDRTRFSQSTRDVEAKVADVANDVAAGYFPETDAWQCTPRSGNSPLIQQNSTGGQGTNQDCIFIGKALQFGPNDANCGNNCSEMRIATIVGHRTIVTANGEREVETLAETRPGAAPSGSPYDDRYFLQYGLGVYGIYDDTDTPIGGVAFLSSLGASDSNGDPISGSQTVGLYRLNGSLGVTASSFDSNAVRGIQSDPDARIQSATLCLSDSTDETTGRRAALVLTEQAGGVGTQIIVDPTEGVCSV